MTEKITRERYEEFQRMLACQSCGKNEGFTYQDIWSRIFHDENGKLKVIWTEKQCNSCGAIKILR